MQNGRDQFRESVWPPIPFPEQYLKTRSCSSEITSHRDDVARLCAISTEDPSSRAKAKPDTVNNKIIGLARVSTNYSTMIFPCAFFETSHYFVNRRESYGWD